jgi:hypothetical protein
MKKTATKIEFTQEFQPAYKHDERLSPEMNQMLDTFCNLLNAELKDMCHARKCETSSVIEVLGTLSLEYGDVEQAARKRDDIAYRKELFDLILKGGLCYVDMQKKFLRLA